MTMTMTRLMPATMQESSLPQRVFDDLYSALAMMDLLSKHEIIAIANGLGAVGFTDEDSYLWRSVSNAVLDYAAEQASDA